MKKRKNIMLDEELFEDLRGVSNESALINELLVDYFKQSENMTLEKLNRNLQIKKEELVKVNSEIRIIKEQIEDIETYNKRIKEIFKNIPREILNDLKDFPNMTIDIFETRYNCIYKTIYNITWEECKKVFEEFKKIKDKK